MNHSKRFEPRLVRYVADGAMHDSARSLELLRAIEATVEVNTFLYDVLEQSAVQFTTAIEAVCEPRGDRIDPVDADGSIQTMLETALDNLGQLSDTTKDKRISAVADKKLRNDDGVVETFDRLLAAIDEAHCLLNELNWAIIEHDAELSPLSGTGPFGSAEDVVKALLS